MIKTLGQLLGRLQKNGVPMFLQTEAAECGLACIAMISAYHGHDVDLSGLRTKFAISLKGSTLVDLIKIAAALDFSARPLRLELEGLKKLQTPSILHWDLKHFVVLVASDSRSITINDPAIGRLRLSWAAASRRFSGVALELRVLPDFQPQQAKRKVRIRALMGTVYGLRRAVFQVLGLALSLEVVAMFAPLFLQWTVDQAIAREDRHLLGTLAAAFLLLAIVQVGIGLLRGWTVIRVATSLNVQWLGNVFAHLIRLPISYFEKRHLGDVTSRFGSVESIQRTLTSTFVEAVLDGLTTAVVLTMMFLYDPLLSLVTLCAVAAYASAKVATYRATFKFTQEQIVSAAKQQSTLFESIRGIQSIKIFGGENGRYTRWMNLLVETTNRSLGAQRIGLYTRSLNGMLFAGENILVVYLGAIAVIDQKLSLGMLFAFLSYKTTFASRVSALIDRSVEIFMLKVHSERLADIVLTPRESTVSEPMKRADTGSAKIEVRNLCFRYSENEPLVIDGLSFVVQPGEAVAITGQSGCGKTTLVKIMLGLLVPVSGDVVVDGVSIFERSPGSYRSEIAAVMQDDQLFAGSIEENICFFASEPDKQFVELCSKVAAIHEDIQRMPMRYGTLVGDMGAALSGGQKQRVLLARALYKRPRLLFLDEATSHLDVSNELLVNESVRKLTLTRVIIAHRPETIAMADRVIELDRVV